MLARMRKWRNDFAPSNNSNSESWYDLIDDWELIEASFTQQYGIRLSVTDIDWYEFQTKLQLLNEKTPLGQMVSIRAEDDPEILKHFTKEQKKVRSDYRIKKTQTISKADYDAAMAGLKEAFKSMAKKKK